MVGSRVVVSSCRLLSHFVFYNVSTDVSLTVCMCSGVWYNNVNVVNYSLFVCVLVCVYQWWWCVCTFGGVYMLADVFVYI